MPCGLLHAALLLAAVASSPGEGAAVMAVFALTSTLGLLAGPLLWLRWAPTMSTVSLRLAGATLAALAGWSFGHTLWADHVAAWCA
jgi:sulfite exporter TauE/SafE